MSFDHVMATACAQTITILYIYLCVWGLDLRLNNINYSCWYFSSSVNHYILILNLWNTIQLKYHNQWVSYLWYLPSTATTFLAIYLTVVLQLSEYSVFYNVGTSIQLYLPWRSYSCQCLNTEASTWGNRDYSTKTLSISYSRSSYIRLVVTL